MQNNPFEYDGEAVAVSFSPEPSVIKLHDRSFDGIAVPIAGAPSPQRMTNTVPVSPRSLAPELPTITEEDVPLKHTKAKRKRRVRSTMDESKGLLRSGLDKWHSLHKDEKHCLICCACTVCCCACPSIPCAICSDRCDACCGECTDQPCMKDCVNCYSCKSCTVM